MPYYDTVAHIFQQHIEHLSLSVDAIADITSNAASTASQTIISDRKLLVCGIGVDCAGATLLTELLRKGLLRERPTLPVVELTARNAEPLDGAVNWLGQQLTALGQPGDLAIVFASTMNPVDLEFLAAALTKRDMESVWIGSQGPGASLVFPGADIGTTLALCQASAICLAHLIDITTFGPLEELP